MGIRRAGAHRWMGAHGQLEFGRPAELAGNGCLAGRRMLGLPHASPAACFATPGLVGLGRVCVAVARGIAGALFLPHERASDERVLLLGARARAQAGNGRIHARGLLPALEPSGARVTVARYWRFDGRSVRRSLQRASALRARALFATERGASIELRPRTTA